MRTTRAQEPPVFLGAPTSLFERGSEQGVGSAASGSAFRHPELGAVAVSPRQRHPAGGYSLAQLEQEALANHPAIARAEAVVEAARGRQFQAGLKPNPTLGLQATEVGNEAAAGQQGIYLQQLYITAGKLTLDQQIAEADIKRSRLLRDIRSNQILNSVRRNYYQVLGAQLKRALARDLLASAERGLKLARDLVEVGEATRPDIIRADSQVELVRVIKEIAENQYRRAWRQLAAAVGDRGLPARELQGSLEEELPELSWDQLADQLVERNPFREINQIEIDRAQQRLRRAEVEPVPNVTVQAGVAHDFSTDDMIVNLQVSVPIPVSNRNQGGIVAAQADLAQASLSAADTQLLLQDKLAIAFEAYQNAKVRVDRYRDFLVPKAAQSLELIREGKQLEEFTFLQVLVAQRTYFETRLEYVDALIALWASSVELRGYLLAP